MELEATLKKIKLSFKLFSLDYKSSKMKLWRSYQRYIKSWNLDNFDKIDDKLLASRKIDEAHESYDFIKKNWSYIGLIKEKDELHDRTVIILVFLFLLIVMLFYMQDRANKRVSIARQETIQKNEDQWGWTHGVSPDLIKKSKDNALDKFWGKIFTDSVEVKKHLIYWPLTLNKFNQKEIELDINNGGSKHSVFLAGQYQEKSMHYDVGRKLSILSDNLPQIILEKVSFYKNHYEITFNMAFGKNFDRQRILDLDLGNLYMIESRYYITNGNADSVWTKKPTFPIYLDDFFSDCVKSGGGIVKSTDKQKSECVFRFQVTLPYETEIITFRGVGSPINNIPLNMTPYINMLNEDWSEINPYRKLEWNDWKPLIID